MAFIIFLVVVLFILAITDLVVGVSNDAVNFLNSAIGSRVTSFRNIIIIASAGVILGSFFSSGIMEVARTGIFRPGLFTFDVVLWIFLAVMLTDIVLLDVFNTLGLPTSTTVSIIFELLGASMVAGILFSIDRQQPASQMLAYINAGNVITIISGIFLSIVIAFTVGVLVQYLSRLLFSFDYEEKLRQYGALYAGAGITLIIYFLLIKGLKGTTIIPGTVSTWIDAHTKSLLILLFLGCTLVCLLLQRFARLNPLKLVVLLGTFSLAMAFAGNDLVNFLGVPITGFLAFENWKLTGVPANESYQVFLESNEVVVPNYMLLIAGMIMAATLWFSSKAKRVTETEVKLGSQQEGEERFQPNQVSRSIVKTSMLLGNLLNAFIPKSVSRYYNVSFQKSKIRQATIVHDRPAFDLLRASANLILASAIIALATSYKLPLSTTYVSFMVAMGTSLADKAWGRETAVYRVAGVLSVIGGWFITAIIAFAVSGVLVTILMLAREWGAVVLIAAVGLYILLSHVYFARKVRSEKREESRLEMLQANVRDIYTSNKEIILLNLGDVNRHYNRVLEALEHYDENALTETYQELKNLEQYSFKLKARAVRLIREMPAHDIKSAEIILFSTDLVDDIFSSIYRIGEESLHYVSNLHQPPEPDFIEVMTGLNYRMNAFLQVVVKALGSGDFVNQHLVKVARDDVREYLNSEMQNRLLLIQEKKPATKQATLETTILLQSRDILAVIYRIYNLYRKYAKPK